MSIVIDCEFTGLDNTFVDDNEIVQLKLLNVETGIKVCKSYATQKALSAYNQIMHKVARYEGERFSTHKFGELLAEIAAADSDYWGFSTEADAAMLCKYGVDIEIKDIQEMLRLSEYESQIATQGCSLECAYFIVTGKYPPLDTHACGDELDLIVALFHDVRSLEFNEHFSVMPYGHCAGMPIADYVEQYRRQADGYRFNNDDVLAKSLTAAIPSDDSWLEAWEADGDEWDDDDDTWGDDDDDDA